MFAIVELIDDLFVLDDVFMISVLVVEVEGFELELFKKIIFNISKLRWGELHMFIDSSINRNYFVLWIIHFIKVDLVFYRQRILKF
jgi:hypothetical protein